MWKNKKMKKEENTHRMNNTCEPAESGMYYNINKHIRVPFQQIVIKQTPSTNSQTHIDKQQQQQKWAHVHRTQYKKKSKNLNN